MTEQEHLSKLFSDLYDGSPWIDPNIVGTLEDITAKEAATKVFPHFNSIWEIVNHMISWRETALRRLSGEEVETPEDNYFSYIRDRSEAAWQESKDRLKNTQDEWLKVLKKMKKKSLEEIYVPGPYSHNYLINGILQHDAYHLGQIRLLLKLIRFRS
jgi:uncharacterized damage-inducible protein DinB